MKMSVRLATALMISLLFLFASTQSLFVVFGGKWYYWMEPGIYAKYAYFNGGSGGQEILFLNGSAANFSNLTLVWQIIDVYDLYAIVDYNVTFYDVFLSPDGSFVKGQMVEVGTLIYHTNVTVRLDTLELVENGASWGRWPYWVRGGEVGKNFTMIHNYPFWKNGEPVNVTVCLYQYPIAAPIEFKIDTPVYNFSKKRLLYTYTHPVLTEETGIEMYAVKYEALYDSVSLILLGMVSQMGAENIADDVLYHKLGFWQGWYVGDILLVDSNVNFEPFEKTEETSPVTVPLIIGVATVAILLTLGINLQLKSRRWRRK